MHEILPSIVLLAIRKRLGGRPSSYQNSLVFLRLYIHRLCHSDIGRMQAALHVSEDRSEPKRSELKSGCSFWGPEPPKHRKTLGKEEKRGTF